MCEYYCTLKLAVTGNPPISCFDSNVPWWLRVFHVHSKVLLMVARVSDHHLVPFKMVELNGAHPRVMFVNVHAVSGDWSSISCHGLYISYFYSGPYQAFTYLYSIYFYICENDVE